MTQIELTLRALASGCEDANYRGLIYSGGYLYATNKKNLVRTKFDYPKEYEGKIRTDESSLSDVDALSLHKIKEVVSRYEKERGIDNVNLEDLGVMISFAYVYNEYAKQKIQYIRVNNALYSLSVLKYINELSEHFNLYMAATSKIKVARALICHDADTVVLMSEAQPEESNYSYIEYRDSSIVFGELNLPKLKALITKKLEKAKTENKSTKIKELSQHLNVLSEFANIKH